LETFLRQSCDCEAREDGDRANKRSVKTKDEHKIYINTVLFTCITAERMELLSIVSKFYNGYLTAELPASKKVLVTSEHFSFQ